jgi:hypothetical protein
MIPVREHPSAGLVAAFFALFLISFVAVWALSARLVAPFRALAPHLKADWSSRAASTIHAVGSTTMALYCLVAQPWDKDFEPAGPLNPCIPILFSFSVGFFLCDLCIIVSWQVPSWTVFVIHHVVAMVPYCICLFGEHCQRGYFLLVAFLVVELSTVPLNVSVTLEQLGYAKTPAHRAAFLTVYVSWLLARVLWPAFLMVVLYRSYLLRPNLPSCLIPALVCAHIIALFCWMVFFFIWTPELLRTVVRAPTDAPERSPLMEVRAVAAAGDGDGDPLLAPSRQRSFEEIRVLDPIHRWENTVRSETLAQTTPPGNGSFSLVAGGMR